ncbi:nuclear transport factor 2 family protein [Pseudoxanthomonas putridarboris]|uniref:Nuclear transport factor 2 family protein n=1 Tax=Pseudoxanthomonas putridarboris TaxID=752605 RepID=A0ABU9J7L1_9GAMM
MNIRLPRTTFRTIALGLLVLAATFALPASAQAQDPDRNTDIVRQAFDAWAAGTGGPYDLLADDAVWTITGNSLAAKTYESREAFLSEVIRPFNARMSTGLKPTIRNLYSDGDTVIVFFDASGTARDGKPYANTYAWFLELRDGRIAKAFAFFDSIAFDEFWTRVSPAP